MRGKRRLELAAGNKQAALGRPFGNVLDFRDFAQGEPFDKMQMRGEALVRRQSCKGLRDGDALARAPDLGLARLANLLGDSVTFTQDFAHMVRTAPVQHRKGIGAKASRIAQASQPLEDRQPAFLSEVARGIIAYPITPRRARKPRVPSAIEPLHCFGLATLRHHDEPFVIERTCSRGSRLAKGRGLAHHEGSRTDASNGSICAPKKRSKGSNLDLIAFCSTLVLIKARGDSDMQQPVQTADFSYGSVQDPSGLPARVAIFADRAGVRREIEEDLGGAGFRTIDGGAVADLVEGAIALLGDVVMVDCPVVEGATLAALARLDMRVARSGAKLIVSTSIDALDDVFAALDQSDPQILVQASRAERVVAVGRVLADIANPRVREMTENDRLSLLHLSRQVEAIASKLEGLSERSGSKPGHEALRAHSAAPASEVSPQPMEPTRFNSARHALPDPRLVRRLIAARHARSRFFEAELFADPAWDMLLDLTAAHAENQRVSVTSLCIAAMVPATTALRWIKQLVDSGVFERVADPADRRRAFIALSDQSKEAMARYFAEVEIPLLEAA